jgi:hypothetical protein
MYVNTFTNAHTFRVVYMNRASKNNLLIQYLLLLQYIQCEYSLDENNYYLSLKINYIKLTNQFNIQT